MATQAMNVGHKGPAYARIFFRGRWGCRKGIGDFFAEGWGALRLGGKILPHREGTTKEWGEKICHEGGGGGLRPQRLGRKILPCRQGVTKRDGEKWGEKNSKKFLGHTNKKNAAKLAKKCDQVGKKLRPRWQQPSWQRPATRAQAKKKMRKKMRVGWWVKNLFFVGPVGHHAAIFFGGGNVVAADTLPFLRASLPEARVRRGGGPPQFQRMSPTKSILTPFSLQYLRSSSFTPRKNASGLSHVASSGENPAQ